MNPNPTPHRPQAAECAVLGSMLRLNVVIGDVLQLLSAESFYEDAHQKIFRAIVLLFQRNRPVDAVTVGEELVRRNQDRDLGGLAYLGDLLDAAPTAGNATHYAQIVADAALLRSLHRVGCDIAASAEQPTGSARETLEAAEKCIFALAGTGIEGSAVEAGHCVNEVYERLQARVDSGRDGVTGVSTGFLDLDEITAGLQGSELIIVAARPSIGKTTLGSNFAVNAAVRRGVPTLFVSLEQSRQELTERMLCSLARVNSHNVRRGILSADEFAQIAEAGDKLRAAPLVIDDTPEQSVLRIASSARRLKARKGLGLVLIDYLQLVSPDSRREPRHEQVAGVSRRLKFLARELAVPVVALAQLNRGPEERAKGRPKLSDLRESGGIEADADTVLMLHRPDGDEETKATTVPVDVIIGKQRNGPTGTVKLTYQRRFLLFENFGASPFD